MLTTEPQSDVLNPLVKSWLGILQRAKQQKQPFVDVGEQCTTFFSGSVGYMWDSDFFKKFVGGRQMTPRFKITVAKAFELVALYGPTLYWRNPTRIVKPRRQMEVDLGVFGQVQDPSMAMMLQQAQMEQQQQGAVNRTVSALLGNYLNYTPTEQPGGGLANHSSNAITEALIKGMGCLWPRPYTMPGSDRVLTGCFYDSVDRLLIDPDATSLYDAKWIAQEVYAPTYQAEREFSLPAGTLKDKGTHETGNRQGASFGDDRAKMDRQAGISFDMIRYYRIWTKCGIGSRMSGPPSINNDLGNALESVVGDWAYLCVTENVPWPLNMPTAVVNSSTDDVIAQKMRWPIPYWLDDRWPVTILDFYRKPNSPWSIAPMAPGLGELTFINVALSQLMSSIWMRSRTIVAYDSSLGAELEAELTNGKDLAMVKVRGNDIQNLDQKLKFIGFPEMGVDIWKIIDAMMVLFDKRVGLSELLYSMNAGGVASRSAEDAASKRQMSNIRPDYMASKVESWQSEAADMEKLCSRWFVEGRHLEGLMGPLEQQLWDQLIVREKPELIVRDMRCTAAANSTRKPDKQKDVEDVGQLLQYFGPMAMQWAMATQNPSILNGMMRTWGEAVDKDVKDMMLEPPPPPPQDDQAAMAAQQQMQLMQAEHEQKLAQTQQQHQQKVGQAGQQHEQKLTQAQEAHQQAMLQKAAQLMMQMTKPEPKPKSKGKAA